MSFGRSCRAGLVASTALIVAACGYTPGDRAVSGGLIGAGTGAGVAAVSGGNVGTGALVGGAAGALAGVATRADQINLGRPLWR